eukprot:CAMPEP_0182505100 /NCGR_PEP_ID=MMETSP1321-20130603/18459_1 /TAXON_ID=91990 /ORGANISM="Bolidomonas sp., Strain RCC1657" /LENGTH=430 /DNA_ID=CAMNT_0024710569 /DNA_START=123 /DNA_END=1412 /DNA_ORIENTATION=+
MGPSKVEKGLCKDKGEDDEINFVLQLVMSSLSVIGSTCIIVSYYLMPKNQKAKILRCLLVWLSAMDLGASSAYLLSPLVVDTDVDTDDNQGQIKNEGLCTFQAISSTFCSMSSFLTTCLIGIYLHQAVIRDTRNQRWKVIHTHSGAVFLLVAILFPLALCFVVLGNGKFGFSPDFGEQWCWIKSNTDDDKWDTFMWRMIGGKAVELSTLVVIIFTYIPTMLRLRKLKLSEGNNSISRLAFVPGAFVILRFPSLIRTVLDIVADTADESALNCIEFLSILQSLGDPSQGFVNGLAYCVGSIKMRRVLCRAFCCRKEENDGVVTWEDTNERLRDTSATGTGAFSKRRSRQRRAKGPGQVGVAHGQVDSNGNSWRDSSGVGPDIDKCISDSDNDDERYVLDDELDEEMGEPGDGSSGTSGTSGTNSNNSFEDD